jgi:rhodanese-related sulfurtransferase
MTSDSLSRGVVTIVVMGVVLGLGYNVLARLGRPPGGLAWIGEPAMLPSLPAAAPAAAVVPAGADDPLGIGTGGPGAADGLPEIPDLERPFNVDLATVKRFVDAGAALLVDARDPDEHAEGHIPGSVNLPWSTAGTDPAQLEAVDSGGRPIIVYCGGGTCEVSIHLAESLVHQFGKRRVLVYMGGFPEWAAAGYPVERRG